jgi:hypothetical protein
MIILRRNLFIRLWILISILWLAFVIWLAYREIHGLKERDFAILIAIAFVPSIILFLIGWGLSWIWERFARGHWLSLPAHMRRGFLRLYLVVAVPWIAWYGYQIYDLVQRSRYISHAREIEIFRAFWSMLIVPIGGPILFSMIVWTVAGFRKFDEATPQSEPPSHPSTVDYYAFVSRAVSELSANTAEARETLYERARTALDAQLHRQDQPMSSSQIANERTALELAIRRLEKDAQIRERQQIRELKKPSTALLIASVCFFPVLWMLDFTSMSLYWVARLPKIVGWRLPPLGKSF